MLFTIIQPIFKADQKMLLRNAEEICNLVKTVCTLLILAYSRTSDMRRVTDTEFTKLITQDPNNLAAL